ncbi:hypothetical protein J6590_063077 [Homalodisca vitripennis]|nr:hypothetical protein J6590_063077 [Homalodisca vitripennis]
MESDLFKAGTYEMLTKAGIGYDHIEAASSPSEGAYKGRGHQRPRDVKTRSVPEADSSKRKL